MRIGINGLLLSTEAGYRQSGIDRYLRGLALGAAGSDGGDDLILYAEQGAIDPDRFELHPAPSFTRQPGASYRLGANGTTESDPRRGSISSMARHSRCRRGCRYPASSPIHDLAFWRWPDQVPKRRGIYLARAVVAATKQAHE